MKFSPDGRTILSTGGDGCILIWKVPPTLVASMQDRLLELYSTAQRRLETAKEATKSISDLRLSNTGSSRSSGSEKVVPEKSAADVALPSPPPPTVTVGQQAKRDVMPPPAPAAHVQKGK